MSEEEEKGCYAREILGSKINYKWEAQCHERAFNHKCCKDCNHIFKCEVRCHDYAHYCSFYTRSKDEALRKRLAYNLDHSAYWRIPKEKKKS